MLGTKELIRWAIEAALDSQLLNRILVNSDSEEVLKIAAEYDGVIPLKRPDNLAHDTSPAIDYVKHSLEYMQSSNLGPFDAIAIIQPSSPFTLAEDVDHTIKVLADSNADSSVSVMKLDHAIHPVKLKTLMGNKLIPYLEEEKGRMAAHDLPELYVRNCAVYVSTISNIDQGQIIGNDCRAYVMPRERSIDINDPIDLAFAKFLYAQGSDNSIND